MEIKLRDFQFEISNLTARLLWSGLRIWHGVLVAKFLLHVFH